MDKIDNSLERSFVIATVAVIVASLIVFVVVARFIGHIANSNSNDRNKSRILLLLLL